MRVQNPIFKVDMPDPDVIRVGDTYYMVSTTMFFMPGGVVLKSRDLVHWEQVSYIFDKIADNDNYELRNGKHAYGKGQWATSLICHEGIFYACFVCHDIGKTFIYHTRNIEESFWERYEIDEVFHDMSFLFWEGKKYLIYGNGTIYIRELRDDLSGVREDGLNRILIETPKEGMWLCAEGCRAYTRNGYIYLSFIDIPSHEVGNGRRRQICYRSKSLLGPYERQIIMDDDAGLDGRGIAQGPFIEGKDGNWYAMLFQDRASVGRIPYLMPMTWEKDWPLLGINHKVPLAFDMDWEEDTDPKEEFVSADSFCHTENKLGMNWQWNHNPMPECWSFTKRPGYLHLEAGQLATGLMDARNTLTQRTCEPGCSFTVELDATGMKNGDFAGLCAFMSQYGQIGLSKDENRYYIHYVRRDQKGHCHGKKIPYGKDKLKLRIDFDFENFKDEAVLSYFEEEEEKWIPWGDPLLMHYTLDVFVGYRIGVFYYATKETGGCVDFRNFTFDKRTP